MKGETQGKANIEYSSSKQYLKWFILSLGGLYLSLLAGSSPVHGVVVHVRSSARLKCSSGLRTMDQLSGFSPRSATAAVCLRVSSRAAQRLRGGANTIVM